MAQLTYTHNNQQRTVEWASDRLGRFTASEFHRLMTEPRSKADKEAGNLSQGATTYVMEKLAERLTGKPAKDDFDSKYTAWGEENEPLAKSIYEAVFDRKVDLSGFLTPDGFADIKDQVGGSPDGLVDLDGILEIKCPYTITSHLTHHIIQDATGLKDEKPEYYWQCLGYLLLTNRQWCDFISYHPHFPARMQLKRVTILRKDVDEDLILLLSKLQKATQVFNSLLNSI